MRWAVIFLLLILALASTLITRSARSAPADFTFVNRGDVSTLDLHQMSWTQDLRLGHALFEGLARLDVSTPAYTPQPGVATWTMSPDGLTYTFTIRDNAKWSNGRTLFAQDFVFSWRRALLPETQCDYVGQMHLIKGARAFTEWRATKLAQHAASNGGMLEAEALWQETLDRFDRTVGMRAIDARTLEVTLERPTAYFLDLCAFPTFFPVYPPLIEAHQSLDARTGQIRTETGWTKPGRLVCNGPFVLALWSFKREMRLEANPFHRDHDRLRIQSISIPTIEDGNAAVLAFITGGVYWVSDVTPEYRAQMLSEKRAFYAENASLVQHLQREGLDAFEIDRRLPRDPRSTIHSVPAFGTYWYNFNCLPTLRDGRVNPFADPRVRRAFAMAIDKRSLVDEVTRCGELPATTIIPPGSIDGYASPAGLAFDPDRARALLAQAGYADAKGLPVIEILFNKDGTHETIAQAIAKNWERHLGVSIRHEMKETKVFRQDVKSANYMISRGQWFGDYGDPTTFLDLHRTDDGNNDRKYSSKPFESLLDQAADEIDPAKRMRTLAEAERLLVEEDMPVLPLFHSTTVFQFDAHRVRGLNPFPRNTQRLDLIEIVDSARSPGSAASTSPVSPGQP